MASFICKTHNVKLEIKGNRRIFDTPPGSYGSLEQCSLLTLNPPRQGKFGKCEIKQVEK
ncbi:unnamed protein product [marine sediment metagenome]|uniref:Uncharacterized protein n=1 Tax=marine sediment metagenome TaxID=412755 RepID=X1HML0_9ZZZZ